MNWKEYKRFSDEMFGASFDNIKERKENLINKDQEELESLKIENNTQIKAIELNLSAINLWGIIIAFGAFATSLIIIKPNELIGISRTFNFNILCLIFTVTFVLAWRIMNLHAKLLELYRQKDIIDLALIEK